MSSFASWLVNRFCHFADAIAIIDKDNRYTYAELCANISKMQHFLAINEIKNQEVIAVIADYSMQSVALFFALLENQNIIVPIAAKNSNEIDAKLIQSYADKAINGNDLGVLSIENRKPKHDLIKAIQKKHSSGLILFSSGQTGAPKAMIYDLDNLITPFKLKKTISSKMLVFLVFDHIAGISTLLNALASGSTAIFPENREPDYIAGLIDKHKISVLPASPTFLKLLLLSESHNKFCLASLKMITYGTEPMPQSLLDRLHTVFPSVLFLQTFGTSETGKVRVVSLASDSLYMKIVDPYVEYKIADSGELLLKSKTQIAGYLDHDMSAFNNGWYQTGDLVEKGPDDYFKIIGRLKELINVGGSKVVPGEVENVLLEMSQIEDCLVYGEKNAITGQIVVAKVVLKQSSGNIKSEIRSYCRGKLAKYKIPVKIYVSNKLDFSERFKKLRT